jgi:hypothetical protein
MPRHRLRKPLIRPLIRPLLRPLLWSPVAALVAQLAMAGIAGAVTGGGDFPAIR